MISNVAYIEPIFGASGDMILSAFIDAGLPIDYLYDRLSSLVPVRFCLNTMSELDHGVKATRLNIVADKEVTFRGLNEIRDIFEKSDLEKNIIEKSLNTFEKLAEVEAKIHGIDKHLVHFHELGAIDTTIDIAGFFIALNYFKIEKLYVGKIPVGYGIIQSEHGVMPVPAFATTELLKGFTLYGVEINDENITPTAAALISTSADFSLFPEMRIKAIGYGLGMKRFNNFRNMLRITIGDGINTTCNERILVLEFSVDDMTPELLGGFMEKVLSSGAKDCFFSSVIGKKGRPAILVTILTAIEDKEKICDIIFSETTTIGFRYRFEDRVVLKREETFIKTSLGEVKVKKTFFNERVYVKPEFEDLKKISVEKGIPLKYVYLRIIGELDKV